MCVGGVLLPEAALYQLPLGIWNCHAHGNTAHAPSPRGLLFILSDCLVLQRLITDESAGMIAHAPALCNNGTGAGLKGRLEMPEEHNGL